MAKKAPNKFIAPIIIAGITVGFLASAYKFVFAKNRPDYDQPKTELNHETPEDSTSENQQSK